MRSLFLVFFSHHLFVCHIVSFTGAVICLAARTELNLLCCALRAYQSCCIFNPKPLDNMHSLSFNTLNLRCSPDNHPINLRSDPCEFSFLVHILSHSSLSSSPILSLRFLFLFPFVLSLFPHVLCVCFSFILFLFPSVSH